MKVAVIGAGAVGAVVADAAVAAGHHVTVFVRTPIDALEIERDGNVSAVRAAIALEPSGPPADVVFVTVKATDTASTAPVLAACCGPGTLAVVVQNGLDQALRLAPHLPAGADRVAEALAYLAAERRRPGLVRQTFGDLLMVPAEHADRIAEAVRGGLRVRGTDDMVTAAWRKLLANLVANPITAILDRRVDIGATPAIASLARDVLIEAAAVASADGASLHDDEVARVFDGISRLGATGSSMLNDRRAGRPMEHQFLTGEVVRRAAAHQIVVPVNASLLALLEALDADAQAER